MRKRVGNDTKRESSCTAREDIPMVLLSIAVGIMSTIGLIYIVLILLDFIF